MIFDSLLAAYKHDGEFVMSKHDRCPFCEAIRIKVNREYNQYIFLSHWLLLVIREVSGDFCLWWLRQRWYTQTACETVWLLKRKITEVISPDFWYPKNYIKIHKKIRDTLQNMPGTTVRDVCDLKQQMVNVSCVQSVTGEWCTCLWTSQWDTFSAA